jgi:hypothetical protein
MVILRPRHLEWDLIPVEFRPDGSSKLWETDRHEAFLAMQALERGLADVELGGAGRIDAVADNCPSGKPADHRVKLQVTIGSQAFVACLRRPGKAYEPFVFADQDAAERAAQAIGAVVFPDASREQELYFNTDCFVR